MSNYLVAVLESLPAFTVVAVSGYSLGKIRGREGADKERLMEKRLSTEETP